MVECAYGATLITTSIVGDLSSHVVIEGDNQSALVGLSRSRPASIKLTYIDPPYNTGSTDFPYPDATSSERWVAMMRPLLEHTRPLLTPDGLLAVSIDDNELHHLRVLLDEIFGPGKSKTIVVKMSEPSGVKMRAVRELGTIAKLKEYVVLAGPNGVRDLVLDDIPKETWDAEYNLYLDGLTRDGRDRLREVTDVEEADRILHHVTVDTVANRIKREKVSPADLHAWRQANAWRIVQSARSRTVLELAKPKRKTTTQLVFAVRSTTGKLYIVRGTWNEASTSPRLQLLFADDNLTVHPGDLWLDIKTTGLEAEGGIPFKNGKKPLALIERIVKLKTSGDDIVLDFFAGSGTTGEAVHRLNQRDGGNRRFILVQSPEPLRDPDLIRFCEERGLPPVVSSLTKQRLINAGIDFEVVRLDGE